MANIDGQQDSSDLLRIMKDSLKDVKTSESTSLQNEISLWLEARNESKDQALAKYNEAIQLNNNNPATHYERALVAFQLGSYEQALLDLDTTMKLAQNLSGEASEKEIKTLTPEFTKTQIAASLPPIVSTRGVITQTHGPSITRVVPTSLTGIAETPFVLTQTPFLITETPFSTTQTIVVATPTTQPDYIVQESYKSSFYSAAQIRSAVAVVIKEHNEKLEFTNAILKKYSVLTNLLNGRIN